jgi:tetratricopeptide (TPR) repeat protein
VTLLALGKYGEAEQLLRESLALCHASDDRYGMAAALRYLGLAALKQGDAESSISFFREALLLLEGTGNWQSLQVHNDLAAALWQAGVKGESRRAYNEALATALHIHAHPEALRAMTGIATIASHDGDHATALQLAARVLVDPTSSDEVRHSAVDIQSTARDHLLADQAAQIEEQARVQALAEILATV